MRLDASRSSEPKDWVKAWARSLQPLVRIASRISAWVCRPCLDPAGRIEMVG